MGNFTGITNQSVSLFDAPSKAATTLLQLQTVTSSPLVQELPTATGMVFPDLATYARLSSFPEDLYDLRAESHLVRFLSAMLGDAGVGQLRKRNLLAQLEQSLTSTHFYDLDAFYGSLFGARRGTLGSLPLDPMADVATPDGWDEIHQFDAIFRERVLKMAKAITLGGTPGGMQALAEALTGVQCDITEIWQILDTQTASGSLRTYLQIGTDYTSYGAMASVTWAKVSGTVHYGNLGIDARNEFIVRPKTVYNTSDPDDAVRRAEDLYGVQRVLGVLKPAFSLMSVDDTGLALHQIAPMASLSSDSEYWEVIPRVIPPADLGDVYQLLYDSYDKSSNPSIPQKVVPRPPFTSSQGQQWSYAGEVSSVLPLTTNDYDTVTFYDGKKITYRPENAIIDPRQALAAQSSGTGSIVAHTFSGPRKVIQTHG